MTSAPAAPPAAGGGPRSAPGRGTRPGPARRAGHRMSVREPASRGPAVPGRVMTVMMMRSLSRPVPAWKPASRRHDRRSSSRDDSRRSGSGIRPRSSTTGHPPRGICENGRGGTRRWAGASIRSVQRGFPVFGTRSCAVRLTSASADLVFRPLTTASRANQRSPRCLSSIVSSTIDFLGLALV